MMEPRWFLPLTKLKIQNMIEIHTEDDIFHLGIDIKLDSGFTKNNWLGEESNNLRRFDSVDSLGLS